MSISPTIRREYARRRYGEAHRIYADVHILAAGTECIDVSAIERMKMGDYDPARDFIPAAGEVDASVFMHPGDFLVCLPSDVHRDHAPARRRAHAAA